MDIDDDADLPPPTISEQERLQGLATARLLWGALLSGQIMLLVIVAVLISGRLIEPNREAADGLFMTGMGMLLVFLPMGYFARAQAYKRHWVGSAVRPRGYLSGNVVLWALCEGISIVGLLACLLNASFWPAIIPTILSLGFLVMNFPDGSILQNVEEQE